MAIRVENLVPLALRAEQHYSRWRDPLFWLIFALGVLLRAVRLSFPTEPCFDEIYYVPAAEDYLQGRPDSNSVHPPLAKVQMAAVILLADAAKAYGLIDFHSTLPGRLPSLLAGIGTLWFTHRLAYSLTGRRLFANLSLFLVALDFLSIASSRIAMLDQIQAFWIVAGFALTAEVLFEGKGLTEVTFAGLCFGVATACKWNGLFGAVGAWIALLFAVSPPEAPPQPEADPAGEAPRKGRSLGYAAAVTAIFLVCGVGVYIASYLPFFFTEGSMGQESWQKIYGFHERMVKFRYDPKQFHHRYLSQFYEWPLVGRPVWYYYADKDSWVQGIVGIGNVVFWWPAFFLILESLWLGYRPRRRGPPDRLAQFVCCYYYPLWLFWAASTTGGFFYYMLPMVPIMAVAMARHLEELWLERERVDLPSSAPAGRSYSRYMAYGYLALLVVITGLYYPLITGISVPDGYFRKLFFVDRWI